MTSSQPSPQRVPITAGPTAARGRRVNVEYVSANPTGPMHMGHCRGAVVGDALASLLGFAGWKVTREYYVNDAGAQVQTLARSVHLRYREALGEAVEIPEGFYPGGYLIPIGQALAHEFGDRYAQAPESEWLDLFRTRTVAAMMEQIRADLALLGIRHDVFASEAKVAGGRPRRRRLRSAARRWPHLRRHARAAEGRASRRLGADADDAVPRHPQYRRRQRSPGDEGGWRAHLFRHRSRLSRAESRGG